MKKVLYILIAGVIMFVACAKEETDEVINGGDSQDTIVNPNGGDMQDTIVNPNGDNPQDTINFPPVGPQDTTVTPTPSAIDGELPGEFTVSPTKKVHFSRGNLQYTTTGSHATTEGNKPGKWRFAEHQYDYVGSPSQFGLEDNGNLAPGNVSGSDNAYISSTYIGWIDLFGWGTSGYHNTYDQYNVNYLPFSASEEKVSETYNYFGYGPSLNQTDRNLSGNNVNYDWGVYNAISNGGNLVGQWRTLSRGEWDTVLSRRPNASLLKGNAMVCGVKGLVLLPDSWALPNVVTFTPGCNDVLNNNYTEEQWRVMEGAGAVFLPAAGRRFATDVYTISKGYYWLSTAEDEYNAYYLFLGGSETGLSDSGDRSCGFSVRLVR